MKVRSIQLLVNDKGKIIMGTGRMRIFESINRTRSINKTAKELEMAYKTVWSKIKATQENLGEPVVHTDKVKGTKLTSAGKKLLDQYREFKNRCIEADDAIFDEIFMNRE